MTRDGGPAFPCTIPYEHSEAQGKDYLLLEYGDMTLRDWFAGQALTVLVAEALRLDHKSWAATAQHAYLIADAMLQERDSR